MAVAVRVKSRLWPIGASDFFHAFFSAISYHLEPDGWGSRFPTLMNQLYQISDAITDLSNYLVTDDGRDLFDVLHEALSYAERAEAPARVW